MSDSNIESSSFVISSDALPKLQAAKERISQLFETEVICSEPRKNDNIAWFVFGTYRNESSNRLRVQLKGIDTNADQTRNYILSLTQPDDSVSLTLDDLSVPLLRLSGIRDHLEREFGVCVQLDEKQKTISVSGTQLSVVLASSAIEDLIEKTNAGTLSASPGVHRQTSRRLDDQLQKALETRSAHVDYEGLSAEALSKIPSATKRHLLEFLAADAADDAESAAGNSQASTISLGSSPPAESLSDSIAEIDLSEYEVVDEISSTPRPSGPGQNKKEVRSISPTILSDSSDSDDDDIYGPSPTDLRPFLGARGLAASGSVGSRHTGLYPNLNAQSPAASKTQLDDSMLSVLLSDKTLARTCLSGADLQEFVSLYEEEEKGLSLSELKDRSRRRHRLHEIIQKNQQKLLEKIPTSASAGPAVEVIGTVQQTTDSGGKRRGRSKKNKKNRQQFTASGLSPIDPVLCGKPTESSRNKNSSRFSDGDKSSTNANDDLPILPVASLKRTSPDVDITAEARALSGAAEQSNKKSRTFSTPKSYTSNIDVTSVSTQESQPQFSRDHRIPIQKPCNVVTPIQRDSASIRPPRGRLPRHIVIDGSNVAMAHGLNKKFSFKGIKIVVEKFVENGYNEVTAFVPHWRKSPRHSQHPNVGMEYVDALVDSGRLVWVPSRKLNTGRVISHYDDRFIVRLAMESDGIVVSNDNYRDLQCENNDFRMFIEKWVIGFSFVGDYFMIPDDPLGPQGPYITEFLTRPDPNIRGPDTANKVTPYNVGTLGMPLNIGLTHRAANSAIRPTTASYMPYPHQRPVNQNPGFLGNPPRGATANMRAPLSVDAQVNLPEKFNAVPRFDNYTGGYMSAGGNHDNKAAARAPAATENRFSVLTQDDFNDGNNLVTGRNRQELFDGLTELFPGKKMQVDRVLNQNPNVDTLEELVALFLDYE